jgi:hypothetical protein
MQNNKLIKTIVNLKKLNNDFENSRLRIFSSQRMFVSKFIFFRYICASKEFFNSPYRDILINYFKKSEKMFPGSSYYLSKSIVSSFFNKESHCNKDYSLLNKDEKNFKIFLNNITNKKTSELFENILRFSGPDASLKCSASDTNEITVKKTKNPQFNVSIHKDFANIYFNKVSRKTQTCVISVMDAYIERESEVMPLLNYAKERNLPFLFVCRGISDAAANSLKAIILKKNILVYPYISKFDNEDPFKLIDLSKVLGCDLLNVEAGDTLYRNSVDKSCIKEVKVKWHEIEVIEPITTLNKEISDSITHTNDLELLNYLIKRKSRVSTNVVEILIPKIRIELLTEIKYLIFSYNNIAAFGLAKKDNEVIPKRMIDITDKLTENILNTLNSIGYVVQQKAEENELR